MTGTAPAVAAAPPAALAAAAALVAGPQPAAAAARRPGSGSAEKEGTAPAPVGWATDWARLLAATAMVTAAQGMGMGTPACILGEYAASAHASSGAALGVMCGTAHVHLKARES